MEISISTNAVDLGRRLSNLALRQMPFAISTAVNSVGRSARDKEHKGIDQYFNLRTPWLKKQGAMPFIPSNRRQSPNPFAIIGVADDVAALAATGGQKKGKSGKSMAVPLSDAGTGKSARAILNPGKETLPPSKWPGKIVKPQGKKGRKKRAATPQPFILKSKSTGQTYVAVREGKGSDSLDILYSFVNTATVPLSWPLVGNVESFVGRNYERIFTYAIENAIATAR